MSARPTVLVLRALGLGDFLTGLPALSLLRRALPGHEIVLATPRELHDLARLSGLVDDTVHAHELDPIDAAPRGAELAIDLHGNGPASRRLLAEHAPRRLLAFQAGPPAFQAGGPQWRDDEHEVHRWCRLVAEGLQLPERDWPGVAGMLPVPPGQDVPRGVTVVHVGAKAAARRWPPGRFAALAIMLRAAGHRPLITAGPAEQQIARAVASAARVHDAGPLDLAELLALVAHARLVVSGDTGVAHAAANYRTPSVTLFGPVSPAVWGPPADPRHRVVWHGNGRGDPHADHPDPALLAIPVWEAFRACVQLEAQEVNDDDGRSRPAGQHRAADLQLRAPAAADSRRAGRPALAGHRRR